MEISLLTDKTLIIPDTAPILLKTEKLEAECSWQNIKQEGEHFCAEGIAEFRLAYLTLSPESLEDCAYEHLLRLLDEAACEPQMPQIRHCISIQCPLEFYEQLGTEEKIVGLQLYDLSHKVISPRAIEIQMEFRAETTLPAKECDNNNDKKYETESTEAISEAEECAKESSPQEEMPPCDSTAKEEPCKEEPLPQEENNCCEDNQEAIKETSPLFAPRFRQQSSHRERPNRSKGGYCMKFYRVREGDSLWSIAEKMQVPAAQISQLNHLEDGEIRVGMLLSIP